MTTHHIRTAAELSAARDAAGPDDSVDLRGYRHDGDLSIAVPVPLAAIWIGDVSGDVMTDVDVSGDVVIAGDVSGDVWVAAGIVGDVVIDGDVVIAGDVDGDVWVAAGVRGDVVIDGAVRGDVRIDGDVGGDVTIRGDVSGDVAIAGDVTIGRGVSGDVAIAGDVGGAVWVSRDETIVAAARADHDRILGEARANEIRALRRALVEGRVDGSRYDGECACLVGTLEAVRGHGENSVVRRDGGSPAERWYLSIHRVPAARHSMAAAAVEWIDDYLSAQRQP